MPDKVPIAVTTFKKQHVSSCLIMSHPSVLCLSIRLDIHCRYLRHKKLCGKHRIPAICFQGSHHVRLDYLFLSSHPSFPTEISVSWQVVFLFPLFSQIFSNQIPGFLFPWSTLVNFSEKLIGFEESSHYQHLFIAPFLYRFL